MDRTVTHSRSFANPLHAILLAFPVALYPAALLTDITYLNTAEIQWTNFSSWLARDGWHSVGTLGLVLSILCSILALIAAFIAYGNQTVEKRA